MSTATGRTAAAYYNYLMGWYTRYASGTYGWHHGIWDAGIHDFAAALRRSNERLVENLQLTPDSHVVDVGCGVGGFAVWVAETFGCRVTGVNIAPLQLLIARQLAARCNVADRCQFHVMDMTELDLDANCADLVVNQETFCYATNKADYLKQVYRVLKAGGSWRSIDFGLARAELSPRECTWYRTVCDGFAIPSFLPADRAAAIGRDSGFIGWQTEDLTRQVAPTARLIMRGSIIPVVLARIRLDWLRFRGGRVQRAHLRGHFAAGMTYSRGLLNGCFRHYLYAARKAANDP